MTDDKILDIKDFKKVNGEVTKVTKKSKKSKKKSKKEETVIEPSVLTDYEIDFEYIEEDDQDYEEMLIEENELLHVELLKERASRKALEKLLNKYLRDSKKGKPNVEDSPNTDGSR